MTHGAPTRSVRRAASSGLRPLLPLLLLFACGRGEPPAQNGKPAAPAAPEREDQREEQPGTAPEPLEKDRAEPKPAASEFAPAPAPPPAPTRSPAKPAAKRSAPAKGEAPSSEEGAPDWATGPGPSERARTLRQRLDDAVKLSTPDCPSARERKQAICDLAQQICQMVDRDPDVASVESYCDDAKQRCSDAEKRTAQRCP